MNKIKKIIGNNKYILKFVSQAAPGFVVLTLLLSLTALADTFSNTWLSKVVFDGMALKTPYEDILEKVLLLLGVLLLSNFFRSVYNNKKSVIAHQRIRTHIRTKLLEATGKLDYSCFENPEFFNKYTRAMKEADARAQEVVGSLSALAYCLVTVATLFSIIALLDPVLFLFAAAGVAVSFILSTYLGRLRFQYSQERTGDERRLDYIHRIFYEPQYTANIRLDGITSYFVEKYRFFSGHLVDIIKKRANKITVFEFISQVQNTVLQIVMILFLTWRVYHGILSIGDYAALLNSTFSLIFQLNYLFSLIPQFYQHSLFIDNLREVLEYEPQIEVQGGCTLEKKGSCSLEFRDVSFRYPGQEKNVLEHVNFSLHSGESIAFVGQNGAGKSTIVKLLLRFYDATEGEILVNGRNIKEYDIHLLRKSFAAVFQDCQLYAASIADNVLAREYREEDRRLLEDSLKAGGAYERATRLKEGIHTQLSKEFDEEGVQLSGGETQKVAVSKAFCRGGEFVLLDEASSALDPISEHELNERMMELWKDKAVFVISHRLSTTKFCDRIYLLHQGKVVESGSHEELMAVDGMYKKMFAVQASGYQI